NDLLHLLEHRSPRRRQQFVVHRLDLHTRGVLVFAQTKAANAGRPELFKRHELVRRYDVFTQAQRTEARKPDAPIDGKRALTLLPPLAVHERLSWLEATLETGRTHQIRKHLLGIGHPVLRDPKYGREPRQSWHPPRLALHAKQLCFVHPITGLTLDLKAELPPDLAQWLTAHRETAETPLR